MSIGVLMLILVAALALAVPISVCFTGVPILSAVFDSSLPFTLDTVCRSIFNSLNSFPILAVPLFMLAGVIMAKGGISRKLFDFFAYFVGKLPAGFPCCVVLTCLMYGAISGSGPATASAVGSMAIPFLVSMGYDIGFCSALVAVAGGLGVIIPPSIPFVLYANAANCSPGDMFIAGILPGCLVALCLCIWCIIYCKTHGEDREKLQQNYEQIRSIGFWPLFKDSFWALLTPVIILGSIYGGIASPTEAAGISIFYAVIVSVFVYKSMTCRELLDTVLESVKSFSSVVFIIGAAGAFGKLITLMQVPTMVQELMLSITSSKVGILLIINLILVVAGMLVDSAVAILILTPVFLPLLTALGVNLIYFGVVMVVNLAVGFVTPPMGMNLFVTSNLTKVPPMKIARNAVPFIISFLTALILINVFPQISLLLV